MTLNKNLLYCTEEQTKIYDVSTYLGFVALWFQVKPILEFVEGKPAGKNSNIKMLKINITLLDDGTVKFHESYRLITKEP